MKAVLVDESNPETPLTWSEVPDPRLGSGEVLVDVHATALNRADLGQRAGRYPPPPGAPDILGLEMAGRVRETAPDVDGWLPGDEVMALLPGGGYAEMVSVPAPLLMPVPSGLGLQAAAGIPEVFLTAFSALFLEGRVESGETVLLHGGASGVGTAAIQMAKRAGCTVFVTAGSNEKIEACLGLGADQAVNYREEDFEERMRVATGGGGVDMILDIVGKDYFERNLRLLRTLGRIVFIATLSGSKVEVDIMDLARRRLQLIGATLRARPLEEKVALTRAFQERFGPDLESGAIRPVIDRVLPIERVEEAHEYMRANRNIGKIVLAIRD